MDSPYGTHEIVELKDEPNFSEISKDKKKKAQGRSRYLEDDINKLFEGINIRTSFNSSRHSDETGGPSPMKNPSKKPMRMSLSSSSGIGYPEPVSIKQALRGLCISQASEMAAIKRLSMPYSNKSDSQSSNEPVQEKKIISVHPEASLGSVNSEVIPVNSHDKNNYPSSKPTPKTRHKGKSIRTSPRAVKTVIRTKTAVKKKSKQEMTSVTPASNASIVVNSQLLCQKCNCAIKDAKIEPFNDSQSPHSTSSTDNGIRRKAKTLTSYGKTVSILHNKNSKYGDKGEFTQSSNSSICEYSSSTSISEERNLSECIIINRPHMSKDIRWQAINHMMKQNGFLGLRHFNLVKKLGSGDIGTVYLAELSGTNYPFAIKVMDNEFLERRQKMPRAHMEREILSILDHPFLPTLYAHFVSENLSCLVMEYCPGGDLHVLRQKQPARFFHEQAARFYVAEVLLALEYLHMLGLLNPTLIQSPSSGMVEPPRISGPCAGSSCIDPFCIKPTCQKVLCFRSKISPPSKARTTKPNLAALNHSLPLLVAEPTEARSNSFVGTHEYLAPEIIKGEGHGSAVDWWTFGIFLYELLYGRTPFKGPGNDETLANVILENLWFPETPLVSFQARDLIKGLLMKEPENRLGSQRGATEIKNHPFFDGLNWALIRCVSPPELPEPYAVTVSKAASLERARKYLDYNGSFDGHLEFELF
ncbi:hypothetical protein E3N88_42156 [Mikania micrantha]|uniref:non-specific serine/threonine protein kinase n=1 Tax=Mikania micrantha TaxID=192012 RepID=A0A5N6LIL3_9ASTR|nr:hypothetical protein E3N88_42156 [Mikania micrantha]